MSESDEKPWPLTALLEYRATHTGYHRLCAISPFRIMYRFHGGITTWNIGKEMGDNMSPTTEWFSVDFYMEAGESIWISNLAGGVIPVDAVKFGFLNKFPIYWCHWIDYPSIGSM